MPAKKGLTAEDYIGALRETNGNISLAARRLKVERRAVQYAIQAHPTVKAAHDEAAAHISDVAEGHLVNAVLKGNLDQVRYWLENKARDRGYGRPQQLEVTGKDGGPIETVFTHAAVAAALAARSAAYTEPSGTDEGGSDGP
jgi:hypothetical protein